MCALWRVMRGGSCMQVAQGMPTAVTIASKSDAVAARVQTLLSTPRFRCYRTTDVEGQPLPYTHVQCSVTWGHAS